MDERCSLVFRAMADRTRMRILVLLRRGEMCVAEIAKHFEITQPSISHHLDVLKRAGLVTADKRGREIYYRLAGETIIECCGKQFRVLGIEIRRT